MRLCFTSAVLAVIILLSVPEVRSQDKPPVSEEPASEQGAEATVLPLVDVVSQDPGEEAPITGGVNYEPVQDPEKTLRDPFKSPFELEKEEAERKKRENMLTDRGDVEEYDIGELDLRGIYLDARTGYWAIFKVGDDYDWFQIGVKFRDGDLVNITDNAVVFKNYTSEDATQVREVVKELHRGEE